MPEGQSLGKFVRAKVMLFRHDTLFLQIPLSQDPSLEAMSCLVVFTRERRES